MTSHHYQIPHHRMTTPKTQHQHGARLYTSYKQHDKEKKHWAIKIDYVQTGGHASNCTSVYASIINVSTTEPNRE